MIIVEGSRAEVLDVEVVVLLSEIAD